MTRRGKEKGQAQQPPEPPYVDRRLRLARPQWIGLPLIALIPVLAMAGVFGERWGADEGVSGALHARIDYPTRLRTRPTKPTTIHVENRSTATLDTIEVTLDSTYLEQFSEVSVVPSPTDAAALELIGVPPGGIRRVHVQLNAGSVGRHSGRFVVRARTDSVVLRVRSTVFP
jgi:hypothetical protein